jgi:hypothetical protein
MGHCQSCWADPGLFEETLTREMVAWKDASWANAERRIRRISPQPSCRMYRRIPAPPNTDDFLRESAGPAGRTRPGKAPVTQTMAGAVLEDAPGHVFAAASPRRSHRLRQLHR